ncbi:ABC transporter substrate-binding protein [Arthrobacter sp. AQ5-05]|uniref:ABC transporter substrate-binding protein n=1 Tax=Arthrobacter sp. AQ5-05 TaxID=2184581 RepID=UPI0012B51195|nr:ABC transporter substrate-binding protein [Arthrobacter sp. AQ5-05]
MPTYKSKSLLAIAAFLAAALAGCSAPATAPPTAAPGDAAAITTTAGTWPRTITHAGQEVTIAAAPARIVALSTETGDMALELVGHGRVAAVSNGSVTTGAGNQLEEAVQVETSLPSSVTPDPEQILALNPDLVLMTSRHEGEKDAAAILSASGVPSMVFESADFENLENVMSALTTLGIALGAEDKAASITGKMIQDRDRVLASLAKNQDSPTVLLLMQRGGKQFIQAKSSAMSTLAAQAGGTIVGAAQAATAVDAELIIKANPDVILVEDFHGAGIAPFKKLLSQEVLANTPAIANGRVATVSAAIASGTAGTHLVEGLSTIAAVLNPDAKG